MNNLPRATWSDFTYAGAFRLPGGKVPGSAVEGEIKQNRGAVGMGTTPDKMFVQGQVDGDYSWCEMNIPVLDAEQVFDELPKATLAQDFLKIEGVVDERGEKKNRYMYCYAHKGQLIGHAVYNYDASTKNKYMVWKADNANDLLNANVSGFYELDCKYLGSGWISPIPDEWKGAIGYNHVIGHNHNFSIVGRASVGPSCYGIDLDQITDDVVHEPIQTEEFLSYPFSKKKALFKTKYPEMVKSDENPDGKYEYSDFAYNMVRVHDDINWPNGPNAVSYPNQGPPLGNDIYPRQSQAAYGFIIPGTSTYAVFGQMFGRQHGSGYRINNDVTYDDPRYMPPKSAAFSGPAPYVNEDHESCIWFYDVNDLIDVKNGLKEPWDLLPYEYHPVEHPFRRTPRTKANSNEEFFGGTYDPVKNKLYLTLRGYDNSKPIVLAYDIDIGAVEPPIEDPVEPPVEEPIEPPVEPPIEEPVEPPVSQNATMNELRDILNEILQLLKEQK